MCYSEQCPTPPYLLHYFHTSLYHFMKETVITNSLCMTKLNTSGFFVLSFTNDTNTHYQDLQNICVYHMYTICNSSSHQIRNLTTFYQRKNIFYFYSHKIFSSIRFFLTCCRSLWRPGKYCFPFNRRRPSL
jgi:hypothetical protein